MQSGGQHELFPEPPIGRPIHRPEPADMFGPGVVYLSAASIRYGLMMMSASRLQLPQMNTFRERVAVDAARAWHMFDRYTLIDQCKPSGPSGAKSRIMACAAEAAKLLEQIESEGSKSAAWCDFGARMHAMHKELLQAYPGIEQHGFLVFVD